MNKRLFLVFAFLVVFIPVASGQSRDGFNPTIKDLPVFKYLCYEHVGPYSDFADVENRFLDEFRRSQIPPIGHEVALYWNSPSTVTQENLRYDIGQPVRAAPKIVGNMKLKIFNYTHVASVIHTGPYATTYLATERLYRWIPSKGYKVIGGPCVEVYLDDNPDAVPDEKKQTEILIPIE